MTYIPQRHIENIKKLITPGKVVVIYGARRVGKTTLLKKYLEGEDIADVLFVNGDDVVVRQYMESQSINKLQDFVGQHSILVVDEAQHVEKIVNGVRVGEARRAHPKGLARLPNIYNSEMYQA